MNNLKFLNITSKFYFGEMHESYQNFTSAFTKVFPRTQTYQSIESESNQISSRVFLHHVLSEG